MGLELGKDDVCRISFFTGMSVVGLALIIMLLSLPDSLLMKKESDKTTLKEFMASIHSFRFIFIMTLVMAGSGLVL